MKRAHGKILGLAAAATLSLVMAAGVGTVAANADEMNDGWVQQSDGYHFYLEGAEQYGEVLINNQWYYFDDNGVMQTGWQNGYYYDANGAGHLGWLKLDGSWYYFNRGEALTGSYNLDGAWYFFNEDGIMQTGWADDEYGQRIYAASTGKLAEGWAKIDNEWYFFIDGILQYGIVDEVYCADLETGALLHDTGWISFQDTRYYVVNGKIQTGWLKVEGKWFYVDPYTLTLPCREVCWIDGERYGFDVNGRMQTGWFTDIDGNQWYFAANGKAVSGFMTIDEVNYWFQYGDPSWSGETDGWAKIDGKWMYISGKYDDGYATGPTIIDGVQWAFDENGFLVYNKWIQDSVEDWYYADASGKTVSGWQKINNKWYYFDPATDHYAYAGASFIDGKWYYFNETSLAMSTGWTTIVTEWYYYDDNGAGHNGWLKSGNYWYYIIDGWMATEYIKEIDGATYAFDEKGHMITGWFDTGMGWIYAASDGKLANGWQKVNNNWYYFEDCWMLESTVEYIDDQWYAFDEKGHMVTGWWIDSYYNGYFAQASGICVTGWTKKYNNEWNYFNSMGVWERGLHVLE